MKIISTITWFLLWGIGCKDTTSGDEKQTIALFCLYFKLYFCTKIARQRLRVLPKIVKKEMQKIPSFTIDHTRLERGIYVSRKDRVGVEVITTFDVRLKRPNAEPVMTPAAAHTIEHLMATFLRNDGEWRDRIIYWGPMGCLTGFYLLVRGDLSSKDMVDLLRRGFAFVADFDDEIPGANAKDCGNWQLHDLDGARVEARKYVEETLEEITARNLVYPVSEGC